MRITQPFQTTVFVITYKYDVYTERYRYMDGLVIEYTTKNQLGIAFCKLFVYYIYSL